MCARLLQLFIFHPVSSSINKHAFLLGSIGTCRRKWRVTFLRRILGRRVAAEGSKGKDEESDVAGGVF